MEDMVIPTFDNWTGRKVLVTGHTGFKGGWLALWLNQLGARVSGFSLDPPPRPSLFETADVKQAMEHDLRGDLTDLDAFRSALAQVQPEVVFHLAAQSLVRESYRQPLLTWMTNCIGTAHVLECVRYLPVVRAVVLVTTDKVYKNDEQGRAFSEADALGAGDPYSSSKAAAELVADSYRAGFFDAAEGPITAVATARSGNVIGGGDWAPDRLVPDCLRAFKAGRQVELRHPDSVRPWQHVLEPLSGYLLLAEALLGEKACRFAGAWNFGPRASDEWSVRQVAEAVALAWGPGAEVVSQACVDGPREAGLLRLDSSRARSDLGWRPRWNLNTAIEKTVQWNRALLDGDDVRGRTIRQIGEYMSP